MRKLESAQIVVDGNTFNHMGRVVRTYKPGLNWAGVGFTVRNNTFSNGPHSGVNGHGYLSVFEDNLFVNLTRECTDSSAFYTGFSWTQRGNALRRNVFRNVRNNTRLAFYQGLWNSAIYLDEEIGGWEIVNNTIQNCAAGVFINGGRDNTVVGNYFTSGDTDIVFNPWGTYSKPEDPAEPCHWFCNASAVPLFPPNNWMCFRKELVAVGAFDESTNSTIDDSLFVKTFPALKDVYNNRPCFPVGNRIAENRYCHKGAIPHPGGVFLSQTTSDVESWGSFVLGNAEDCSKK